MCDPITSDQVQPDLRSYVSQGLTLRYLDWGNPGAPLAIFLHGICDHARSWDGPARALRDRFHVIALDLRGHGDSEWSPDGAYLLAYHVYDLAELIDAIGADRVILIGHSFGGSVASRYAGLFPDRIEKLVLVDGFGPSPEISAQWAKLGPLKRTRDWMNQRRSLASKPARRLATLDEAVARLVAKNARLSAETAAHLATYGVRLHPDGYCWKFDPRVSNFTAEDFIIPITEFWREVTAPTLLCRGAQSWTHDPEAEGQAEQLRDRRSVTLERAGHWLHHDRLDSFIEHLSSFLA